jgi:hypothetical protein
MDGARPTSNSTSGSNGHEPEGERRVGGERLPLHGPIANDRHPRRGTAALAPPARRAAPQPRATPCGALRLGTAAAPAPGDGVHAHAPQRLTEAANNAERAQHLTLLAWTGVSIPLVPSSPPSPRRRRGRRHCRLRRPPPPLANRARAVGDEEALEALAEHATSIRLNPAEFVAAWTRALTLLDPTDLEEADAPPRHPPRSRRRPLRPRPGQHAAYQRLTAEYLVIFHEADPLAPFLRRGWRLLHGLARRAHPARRVSQLAGGGRSLVGRAADTGGRHAQPGPARRSPVGDRPQPPRPAPPATSTPWRVGDSFSIGGAQGGRRTGTGAHLTLWLSVCDTRSQSTTRRRSGARALRDGLAPFSECP